MVSTSEGMPPTGSPAAGSALSVEANGLNVIAETERKGHPRDLFWPWFGANVSVLGLSYGAFVLGFGVSFWPGLIVGVIGIVVSFLICGLIAIAGKRGSAPTLVLSRAAFGIGGNRLPALVSWALTVGWETVLVILSTQATAAVFDELGWSHGTATKVVVLIIVAGVTILGGVMGFNLIMRLQTVITVVTAVLTVLIIALSFSHVHWSTVSAIHSGTTQDLIGALVFSATAFGLGWINAAADYSRYLPRRAKTSGVVGWTTFGGAIAPVILLIYGLLLAGSSTSLSNTMASSSVGPIGALATVLPHWFLIPFLIAALLGLVGGAVLDIYSSGLSLLAAGLRVPRFAAAFVDGVIMIVGSIYGVFIAKSFFGPFQGFLYTLGVPIAAWGGVMLADLLMRRRDYAEPELFDTRGRYGNWRVIPVGVFVVGTVLGWGLVTNATASWLKWQGYLLGPFGLGGKTGAWEYSNIGVLVALVAGFVGTLLLSRAAVRRQESVPLPSERPAWQ